MLRGAAHRYRRVRDKVATGGPDIISAACAGSAQSSIRPARRASTRRERMVEALRHRGPDGEALRRIGPVALAHTRLAIIDVAGGDQPLDSEDGQVTADRQRRDLQPPRPARGARAARPPLGDRTRTARSSCTPTRSTAPTSSAASTASSPSRSGTTASSGSWPRATRFGVKPLYWWTDGRRVALASEIGALLAAGLVTAGRRPRRARPLPRLPLRARAAHAVRGRAEAPAASTLVVEADGSPARRRAGARVRATRSTARRRGAGRPARRALRPTRSSAR